MLVSPCPSCGKTENKEWGSKNGYTLLRCTSCGLIFVFPLPSEAPAIYDKTYFASGDGYGYVDYDRDKEPMRRAFELYLEHIEEVLGRKGNLLDVGAATGYFMNIAKGHGWKVEGVEISDYAASLGRAKGLSIHTGTLENTFLTEESFDAITFFDILEHVRDPKSVLLEANRFLKKGGIVVVTTPDSGSLWARVLGQQWHLVVPPEHLILFNRKNFADLLRRTGFTPSLVTTIGKHFTVPYIFQTLYHWQGLSLWNILAKATNRGILSKLKIPINLHDTFFMIAKKS
ncbi:MAG: class I SAM-dependent methyltransferase [Patescibacteria group bacterium]|nr:class I SAM-dependent methyltransferase [Patescibacteria group bacterium]